MHCYLDDFVGVAPDRSQANAAYHDMLDVAARLGLELSPEKCQPPTKQIEWLGFNISADDMQLTIPCEKLEDTLRDCQDSMSKRVASRKELQRLMGHRQHMAKCVPPARRFMTRIFDALRATPFTGKHTIPDELKTDVKWFLVCHQIERSGPTENHRKNAMGHRVRLINERGRGILTRTLLRRTLPPRDRTQNNKHSPARSN